MRRVTFGLLAIGAIVLATAVTSTAEAAPGYFNFSYGTSMGYPGAYPGYAAYPPNPYAGPQAYMSFGTPAIGPRYPYPAYPYGYGGAYYRGFAGYPGGGYGHHHGHRCW